MITAIIVDDEPYCCDTLSELLGRHCPEVRIVDICYSPEAALESISRQKPDILFLDIEMPVMSGFELLERLPEINFELIFTTSYPHYAIEAIHFSALDYLLKPIDADELLRAVQKGIHRMKPAPAEQIEVLLKKMNHAPNPMHRIAIPTMEGLQMVLVDAIITCESASNYTMLFLKNQQKVVASKTLKDIEELLASDSFARVHHSYLVNLNEVEKYVKGEGGYLVMSDGSMIDIARSRKESVLKKLQSRI